MKSTIVEILFCVVLVVVVCLFGFFLTKIGHEGVGNFINNAGMFIAAGIGILCVGGVISYTVGIVFGKNDDSEENMLFPLLLLVVLMGLCLWVNYPLKKKTDWAFVQYNENPRVASEVAAIQSDPVKIQALQDFLAGKEVPAEKTWFIGDDNLTKRMVLRHVLGVKPEEEKKIIDLCKFPVQNRYYQAQADGLKDLKSDHLAEAQ